MELEAGVVYLVVEPEEQAVVVLVVVILQVVELEL